MKNRFFSGLVLLFFIIVFLIVFQTINAANQDLIFNSITAETYHFVLSKDQEKEADFVIEETKKNKKIKNTIEFEWGAEFLYPYQSADPQKITLWEHNLNWDWEATDSGIIGSSSIESCPLSLKYSLEDKKIKSEISFKNSSQNLIKDLVFKFRINYPSSLVKIVKSENNSQKAKLPPIDIAVNSTSSAEKRPEGQMTAVFEGKEQSGAEYILPVGDVLSGEENFVIIELSYHEE